LTLETVQNQVTAVAWCSMQQLLQAPTVPLVAQVYCADMQVSPGVSYSCHPSQESPSVHCSGVLRRTCCCFVWCAGVAWSRGPATPPAPAAAG
jgi:hypothetical protein